MFGETPYYRAMEVAVGRAIEPLLEPGGLGLDYHVPCIEDCRDGSDPGAELKRYFAEQFPDAPPADIARAVEAIERFWMDNPRPETW